VETQRKDEKPLEALANLDRVVHEPARLAVLSYLSLVESADFMFLLRATGLTWGNLSSHLAKLEAAGYVAVDKAFVRKKPRTTIRLTGAGRDALEAYRRLMRTALRDRPG
jgi:DNA-binding transcriptional ArsR family regulator